MKISLEDPTFLTILLIAVILFAIGLIAFAVFLVMKSRKKDKEAGPEAGKPEATRSMVANNGAGHVGQFP